MRTADHLPDWFPSTMDVRVNTKGAPGPALLGRLVCPPKCSGGARPWSRFGGGHCETKSNPSRSRSQTMPLNGNHQTSHS
ncbi:hypothetical protein AVEN_37591-1 [Araneus ventricosus]|uniref:Uncharacterized protein n=1 Tax=Araneus ventricosus TaxID=182803 RepID=A0A4Y2I751_ARAVE|nr:hypothetical protein AVEN_37591-1 [Araneus ventricosus]